LAWGTSWTGLFNLKKSCKTGINAKGILPVVITDLNVIVAKTSFVKKQVESNSSNESSKYLFFEN